MVEPLSTMELEAVHHRLCQKESYLDLVDDFEAPDLIFQYATWVKQQSDKPSVWMKSEGINSPTIVQVRRFLNSTNTTVLAQVHHEYMVLGNPLSEVLSWFTEDKEGLRGDYKKWVQALIQCDKPQHLQAWSKKRGWNVRKVRLLVNSGGIHPRDMSYLKRQFEEGKKLSCIAQDLGISVSTMSKVVKREGLKRAGPTNWSEHDRQWLCALHRLGFNKEVSAGYMGIPLSTAHTIFNEQPDLKAVPKGKYDEAFKMMVLDRRDKDKLSCRATALLFKLRPTTVQRWALKYKRRRISVRCIQPT